MSDGIPLGHVALYPDCLDMVGLKKFGKAWVGAAEYARIFNEAMAKPTNDRVAAKAAALSDYDLCQKAEELLAALLYGTPGKPPEVGAGVISSAGHWLVINRNFWGNQRAALAIIENGRARDVGRSGSPDWRGSKGNKGVYEQDFFEGPVSVERAQIEAAIERHIKPDVPARVPQSKAAGLVGARTACKQWLIECMAGPPEKVKAAYKADALKKFKGLAGRGFNVAWDEAINETGRVEWAKPGPRKFNSAR